MLSSGRHVSDDDDVNLVIQKDLVVSINVRLS
jgi:hypothetical protein